MSRRPLDLLTVPEAAEYLSVKESFIRRLVYERRIEVIRLGWHVRFRRAALDEWIEENTTPALPSRGRMRDVWSGRA